MSWLTPEERIAEAHEETEEHDRNAPHRGCTCGVCEEARIAAAEGEILEPDPDGSEDDLDDDLDKEDEE